MTLHVRTVALDRPPALLDLLPPEGLAWLQGDDGIIGLGEMLRVDAGTGAQRFQRSAEKFAAFLDAAVVDDAVRQPGTGPVAFASFTFDSRSAGSVLLVPEVVVGRRGASAWLTVASAAGPPRMLLPPEQPAPAAEDGESRVRYAGASIPDVRWLEAVATALVRLEEGVDKVVLARDHAVWSRTPFHPPTLLRRLVARFDQCHAFSVAGLVGATPELLVRRAGDRVTSLVLAGSARRAEDPAEDAAIGASLQRSPKDRLEHELAAASVEEVLGRLCGDLARPASAALLGLANVQHLASRFEGRLRAPATALELAAALHPTAAVGGVPQAAALALIRELEGMDRGRYAGPVGWLDARGDGEFGIALRCAELSGARARLFAGAGIVRGSLPEAELEETRLKLRAMQGALAGIT